MFLNWFSFLILSCLRAKRCGSFFFFFQAEDGLRDFRVTGVQTCALPIWAATYGICRRLGTAGERTLRAGVKTCALVTAATLIASGAVLGEPTVPNPKRSRSLPAEITGT